MSGFPTSFRRVATLLVAVVVALLSSQLPAQAGTPRQVGAPWVAGSSPSSLTLAWTAVPGATRYQVFVGTSYDQVLKTKVTRSTSGRQTSLKISGLRHGAMYCLQVRALSGSKAGKRSPRHCKLTMRKWNDTTKPQLKVATYNVCSNAGDCARTWKWRVDHVVDSIRRADADVIGIQELNVDPGRDQLEPKLTALGYKRAVYKSAKAIYYRNWKVAIAQRALPTEPCETDCPAPEIVDRVGEISLDGGSDNQNKWAVYADFQLKNKDGVASGPLYRFVDAHLITGNTTTAQNIRQRETQRLIGAIGWINKQKNQYVTLQRTIIVGDLNSHRNRANDTPRKVLEKYGFFDSYDRSSAFTTPNFNSANQWRTTPTKGQKYGDHVDHVFLPDSIGSTNWATVHRFKNGGYMTPLPSDHVPVRVTLYLR